VNLRLPAKEVDERVDVSGWRSVEDLFGEPLRREGDRVMLSVPSLGVRALIVAK
jgi:hypothetical protein